MGQLLSRLGNRHADHAIERHHRSCAMAENKKTEMDDYSGPFRSRITLDDFSKTGLKKLVRIGGSIYGTVNRNWYKAVAEEFGEEVADRLHHKVWFAPGGTGDHENYLISDLMGFKDENEVTTPLKVWQCLPAMIEDMELTFTRTGEQEWQMHTPRCHVPEKGEAGGPKVMHYMANKICAHLELFGFRHGAARWNDRIRIDPLKLPPRSDKNEPHCRWVIKMMDEPVNYVAEPGEYVKAHNLERDTDAEIVTVQEANKYRAKERPPLLNPLNIDRS